MEEAIQGLAAAIADRLVHESVPQPPAKAAKYPSDPVITSVLSGQDVVLPSNVGVKSMAVLKSGMAVVLLMYSGKTLIYQMWMQPRPLFSFSPQCPLAE